MGFLKTLCSRLFHELLKFQNPSKPILNPQHTPSLPAHLIFSKSDFSSLRSSIFRRTISLSTQFESTVDVESVISNDADEENKKKTKKPLDVFFKEVVGLAEKQEYSDSEDEGESDAETKKLKQKLTKLETEVRTLKESRNEERENLKKKAKKDRGVLLSNSKPKSLYALFVDSAAAKSEKLDGSESMRTEDPKVYKELSPDMVLFVTHLYKEGYFKDGNFLLRTKIDVTCFENSYGRDFIKFAAEKFGQDNQEIAKWLSGRDLKNVALFGCPSLARKSVFSAKRLRTFFRIQEDTVCSKCILKQSCKFVNQSVWKGDTINLNLAAVMRVVTLYALDSVHPQLVVPNDVKASVCRLLKEVLNLSQIVS